MKRAIRSAANISAAVLGSLYMAYRRLRPFRSADLASKLLNLGCGVTVAPGWVNVDHSEHILIARIPGMAVLLHRFGFLDAQQLEWYQTGILRDILYWDIREKMPFPTAHFEWVYCSHLLEHLWPATARTFLIEIYRLLSLRGRVRIVVPDLRLAVHEYIRGRELCVIGDEQVQAFGKTLRVDQLANELSRYFHSPDPVEDRLFGHRWMYDFWSLRKLLEQSGFRQVTKCHFQQGNCPDLAILDSYPSTSLYVEATC